MHPDDWQLKVVTLADSDIWAEDLTAWSFLLVRRGAAALSDHPFHPLLKAGDVFVVPPGVGGRLTPHGEAACTALHFQFHAELLNGFLRYAERHLITTLVEVGIKGGKCFPASTQLARRFRLLAGRMAPPHLLLHRCQLLEVVGMFLDLQPSHQDTKPPGSLGGKERVQALLAQLSHQELERTSVDELARRCGCSRRHFTRILKGYLRCSLGTLQMELRLERAATMLLSSGVKVITVALDCGFSHLGQFSAKFKNRFGATPAAWRQGRLRTGSLVPLQPEAGRGESFPATLGGGSVRTPTRSVASRQRRPETMARSTIVRVAPSGSVVASGPSADRARAI